MMNTNESKQFNPMVVFEGTMWETAMLKSLLENAEIRAYMNNEINGSGQGGIPSPIPGGNIRVLVANADYEKAMIVVNDFLARSGEE